MCYYCYWGAPEKVAQIYDRYALLAGDSAMEFGPAHIVWGDSNFERTSVQWCIDNFETYKGDHTEEALAAVMASLMALLELPDEDLSPMPEDEDAEEHPELYPPKTAMRKN